METFKYKTLTALLGTTLLFTGTISAYAADYSGSFNGTIIKQEALPIVDKDNRVIVLGNSTAVNKSTGKNGYFDGGDVVVKDFIDMVNGNGTYQGYITFSKDGEQVTNKLNGKIITVMAPDGKTPLTSIEGTFDGLYGTNLYGTLHPVGTFTVKFTSPKDYICEWQVTKFK